VLVRELSWKVGERLVFLVTPHGYTQKHDARPKGARLRRTLAVPGSLLLHRRPRRVTDVTAGAVPAASPQTSVRASAPSCRLRCGDLESCCLVKFQKLIVLPPRRFRLGAYHS